MIKKPLIFSSEESRYDLDGIDKIDFSFLLWLDISFL
jgi:hypothetical protein